MVEALALSVGLTPIVNEVPSDQEVYYGIDNPIPFRQLWSLIMADNTLDYALLENDVIYVGPPGGSRSLQNAKWLSRPRLLRSQMQKCCCASTELTMILLKWLT